jgi:cytoplasmic iron level regulating protein YaaA (DUF328/UPF0246 family)
MKSTQAAAKLLGVTGKHLERALQSNRSLLSSPTLAASQRYTGVVWDHLDLGSLGPGARRRAGEAIIVFSALDGLVGIDDLIPDYRLEMGDALPGIGGLAKFWQPKITAVLAALLSDALVIDLLPHEHSAAWHPASVACRAIIKVRFEHIAADGARKVIGHDAKAAKGLLARHVLAGSGDPAKRSRTFTDLGWFLDSEETVGRTTTLVYAHHLSAA